MSDKPKQRVFITAGGSGIGKAMATAFAADGADIWISDIDQKALSGCPDDWRADLVDVTDGDAMRALFEQIEEAWGGLDVLCCNAGIAGPTAKIEEQPLDGIRACLDVAFMGSFLCLQGALPMMKAQQSGVVIFTSSMAGLHGFPLRAPYAAAKWGLHGVMKTVAMEAGPDGIRANAIAPGCVEGARIDLVISREAAAKGADPEAVRDAYKAGTSLRTFVTAEDVAAMAVFLASPAGRNISGQIIPVDGHTENPDPKL